jgi:hypothetical protein
VSIPSPSSDRNGLICSTITDYSAGNWYDILVNNDACVSAYVSAPFNALTAIFEGDDCGSMTCLDESLFTTDGFKWVAKSNVNYKIFVGGMGPYGVGEYKFAVLPHVSAKRSFPIVQQNAQNN